MGKAVLLTALCETKGAGIKEGSRRGGDGERVECANGEGRFDVGGGTPGASGGDGDGEGGGGGGGGEDGGVVVGFDEDGADGGAAGGDVVAAGLHIWGVREERAKGRNGAEKREEDMERRDYSKVRIPLSAPVRSWPPHSLRSSCSSAP